MNLVCVRNILKIFLLTKVSEHSHTYALEKYVRSLKRLLFFMSRTNPYTFTTLVRKYKWAG